MHHGTVLHGTATKIRLLLTYNEAGHAHRLPPTLWAKCGFEAHSRHPHVADAARSEVVFYRQRASEGLANVPKYYFASTEDRSGTSFLLLEDLLARNATFGSVLRPIVDPQIAQRAVEMLARYHARWWNHPELASIGPRVGLIAPDDWISITLDNFEHFMALPRFEYVPSKMRNVECFRSAVYGLWESNALGPHCLLHNDPHLGNCFFEIDGRPGFVDWQGDTRGCWAHDFSEFLLTALDIGNRRTFERPLLDFYLQQLRSCGVDAPSFDDAWRQYRRNTLWTAYASAVCPAAMQTEELCTLMTQRGMAAVQDLDALASFDG